MPKEVSLKEFIDDNYKMLAVMGVLGAIIAFFARIEGYEGSDFLIAWSFTAFLLVNWELWKTLDEIPAISWRLVLFGASLLGVFSYVSGYVIFNYWQQVLLLGIPILIVLPIIYLLVRFRVEERIRPNRIRMYKRLAYILILMLYIIIHVTFGIVGIR